MTQQTQSQKNTATKKQTVSTKIGKVSPEREMSEERYKMIAEAAYYLAEQRGFEGGRATDDWLQAEAEVNARFEARH